MKADRRVLVVRALVVVWLLVWVPSYAAGWGWRNFVQLCDLAVILTCVGLWRRSALLLSMQALSSLVVDTAWTVDLGVRLASGRDLFGWTSYMWDRGFPLGLRLLSAFHLALPPILILALRKTGYDRRALGAQAALAAVAIAAARVIAPDHNYNFSVRDPLLGRSLGPAPLHLLAMTAALVAGIYLPTHLLLRRALRAARSPRSPRID